MNIGIIGLGRMGFAIAQRLIKAGHTVFGFDINNHARDAAQSAGVTVVAQERELLAQTRIVWLMIPAGPLIDEQVALLRDSLKSGDIIIDGGNSYFGDSIRRAQQLAPDGIHFIDCGTSGGIHGMEHGFCLMVGGSKEAYEKLTPIWQALAAPEGYAYVGPSGAGHYVKMVHNGIEYALMQAYAEGFHLLHESTFGTGKIDLEQVAKLWNHGAVIRSFLLTLVENIFAHDQKLNRVEGTVQHTGMGTWTVKEAHERGVPVPLINEALRIRIWSEQTGGNYATKIVALLRQQFGGHAINYRKDDV